MSKLGFELPPELDVLVRQFVPWGSKGTIITELLWQLMDKAKKDKGQSVYKVLSDAHRRESN